MEEIMRISVSSESPNNTGWFYTDLALPASNLHIADAKQKVRWNGGKESLMLYETIIPRRMTAHGSTCMPGTIRLKIRSVSSARSILMTAVPISILTMSRVPAKNSLSKI